MKGIVVLIPDGVTDIPEMASEELWERLNTLDLAEPSAYEIVPLRWYDYADLDELLSAVRVIYNTVAAAWTVTP